MSIIGKVSRLAAACTAVLAMTAMAGDEAGTVKTVKGEVTVWRQAQKLPATVGFKLLAADKVTTGADSAVGITLRDNTMLSAGPRSSLTLEQFAFNPTTNEGTIDTSLKRGTLSVISGKIAKASPGSVRFRTPTVTLGVRGTEFVMEATGTED